VKLLRNRFAIPVFLLAIFISQAFIPTTLQKKNEQELLAKANLLSLQFPYEKIYLHLDRPSYWAGDDIWFKAYLQNSPIPECNVYVELVAASGDVIEKKICWSLNGLAYGDFQLADTLSSGMYQIRAYTNWMRNFDEEWFFRKSIMIWNLRDKSIKTDLVELKSKGVDLQFFPEGGTFVANVKNRIAFKAIDKNGKGIQIEGEIVDGRGNKITDFKSGFKGMGSFAFVPQEGGKYKALATVSGNISMKVDLPDVQPNAIKMTVDPNDSLKIHFDISTNTVQPQNNENAVYLIIGQTGGQVCYRKEITITGKTCPLDIEKNTLPTGIIKFTVFDNEMVPRCERLVFVNHHDYVNIEIVPDKQEYLTRENVKLDVKAFTNTGIACLTNLSMSVCNPENNLETEKYPNNILTQFLLSSELKGTIEDPAWYFKDDSLSTLIALDNLMLTHGYRYFEWKEIEENKQPKIEFQPEKSIQVKGKVTNWLTGKPIEDCNVTMMFVKSLLAIHNETTDSLGNFVFSDLFFNDTVYVSLQAGSRKGKKKNWIELDKRSYKSPERNFLPLNYRYDFENGFTTTYFLSEVSSDLINRKWHLSDTILLGDINIVAKKRVKGDGHFRPYASADYVIDNKKLEEEVGSIYDAIDGKIAGLYSEVTEFGMAFIYRGYPVSIYLDGIQADYDLLTTFSSSTFDKVEFLKFAPFAGINKSGAALFFFTKRGVKFENRPTDAVGMKSTRLIGYSVIRKFYSPVYETRQPVDEKQDFRSTLYWNPIVRTYSTGMAEVSFFSSDETGTMQIVVEGITADGKLCRGLSTFIVNK